MTWTHWLEVSGVSLPVLLLLFYAMRHARSIVEMCLRAHHETRAEREQRATMVAMAQSLPEGGAVARFEQGRPAWIFRKEAGGSEQSAIASREAA